MIYCIQAFYEESNLNLQFNNVHQEDFEVWWQLSYKNHTLLKLMTVPRNVERWNPLLIITRKYRPVGPIS